MKIRLLFEIILIILQAIAMSAVMLFGFTISLLLLDNIVFKFWTGHTVIEPLVQGWFQ